MLNNEKEKKPEEKFRDIFKTLVPKWRKRWEEIGLYKTETDKTKPKFYCLEFFPYPSGSGLSVGHLRNYVPSDLYSRVKKMQGYNVLHPMGWDAFGFPAENYALLQGVHPAITTRENINNYKRQMMLAELSYDWDKEICSVDPEYYKWTQWFFLLLFKRGLAYQSEGMQWWCPSCKSVLANEQVENGHCWRHKDVEVTKKALKQWYFKITDYADELLDDLKTIDWPESIKKMQENWIGKSYGCEALFQAVNPETEKKYDFPIFTTRIDTVFGVTYMVIAPEQSLVKELTTSSQLKAVTEYVEKSKKKSDIDRLSLEKEKTGVFTGSYAINPANNEKIPIWIADYVILSYGTGIVMAVPAHDTRDFAFAQKYNLPVRMVISPAGEEIELNDAYTEPGRMINSGKFNGLYSSEAIEKITDWLIEQNLGKRRTNYKIRDWLISRQRYWGAPIPIIHCSKCGIVPVPDEDLPVLLPQLDDFRPTGNGESPLASVSEFVNATCPNCGGPAKRETDTMDGFACSSWYFLRYPDSKNDKKAFSAESARYWQPVDLYVGGAEHAVMHLLYARFWVKVMHDAGLVDFKEPFLKLRSQGMILGLDGLKMSKSLGNVVTPDSVVEHYGTDVVRLYILFLGSFELDVAWNEKAISGVQRFLNKIWDIAISYPGIEDKQSDELSSISENYKKLQYNLNFTIKKVSEDIEKFSFNTAIAQLMTLSNIMTEVLLVEPEIIHSSLWKQTISDLLKLLAPMTPFITEELWERTGRFKESGTIHLQSWPSYDEKFLILKKVLYPVQINGKIREKLTVDIDISDDELEKLVFDSPKVQKYVSGKKIKKFIIVPKRLISIAVR